MSLSSSTGVGSSEPGQGFRMSRADLRRYVLGFGCIRWGVVALLSGSTLLRGEAVRGRGGGRGGGPGSGCGIEA